MTAAEAMELLAVIDDYDAGRGPERCVHTFRPSPIGLLGAHWPLDQVRDAIERYGVARSGPAAAAQGHGLVLRDETGFVFIETRSDGIN